jgi:hypothetical protein
MTTLMKDSIFERARRRNFKVNQQVLERAASCMYEYAK